jgi:formyltetrahydrofolate hydrolase
MSSLIRKRRRLKCMDRTTLERRLQAAEGLVQRLAENVAFQRHMIATLDQDGHDVKAAKMFLRRLEASHAKHVAERDRLFKELANRS